jgi:lipopolysaccharide transport system ATP-binding protein
MARPAVCVEGLSKRYQIGLREPYHRFSELLSGWGHRALAAPRDWYRRCVGGAVGVNGRVRPQDGDFWALQDVSFEVDEGEAIGIIGRNGAGKSTLLKILSRITEPTLGRFGLRGRVASLLEVGSGFHPELTGRDNIYLNGALLGMPRPEVRSKFHEIVAFAEIGPFLDTPVKRYSSGMYTRLAFAVAAHLDADILIVDEVLAVGDAPFQRKCLGKMSEVARGGRTVLFVSHNMLAIESLCTRALLLDGGRIAAWGVSRSVTGKYLDRGGAEHRVKQWDEIASAPGGSYVRLRRAAVSASQSSDTSSLDVHTEIVVEFEYWNLVEGLVLNPSVVLYDQEGRTVFNTGPLDEPNWNGKPFPRGLFRSTFVIPGNLLNDGSYEIQLYMIRDASEVVERFDGLLRFTVADDMSLRRGWYGKWPGTVRPNLVWDTALLMRYEQPETPDFAGAR